MNLLLAIVVAILFATGVYLMLKEDLIRLAAGTVLISNAVILFIVAAGLLSGRAPILPLPPGASSSDPLAQALALTAVVIGFAVQMLVLALTFAIFLTHGSLDQDELREAEEQEVAEKQEGQT
jgi:multicomponent Na+:H+ antiporter subunit C